MGDLASMQCAAASTKLPAVQLDDDQRTEQFTRCVIHTALRGQADLHLDIFVLER